jgi:hypothetical protein
LDPALADGTTKANSSLKLGPALGDPSGAVTQFLADLVPLDESWFYLHTDHERIWLASGETPPDRECHTVQSPLFMLTIVEGRLGFMSSDSSRRGESFNASSYTTEILSEVLSWRNEEPETAGQKLIVHSDKARPHMARQTRDFIEAYGMDQTLHPPYSPDLAQSHFYLFGYLKDRFQGQHFDDGDQLFDTIIALTGMIEKVTLQRVFLE